MGTTVAGQSQPNRKMTMSDSAQTTPSAANASFGRIDLTSTADVDYWCGIFQVSNEALRVAVQAVGTQPETVSHYLKTHPAH
jgi:hypothetical protein